MKKKQVGCLLMASLICASLLLSGCGKRKDDAMKYHEELFGDKVYIFSDKDDPAEINQILTSIYQKQETNQFGEERYAICFLPGDYPEVSVNVGFYTQVLGLGIHPTDVKLGALNATAGWLGGGTNHNATCNFWRGVENLEVTDSVMWAVSQATDMRRVMIDGMLTLHDSGGWASGGFLADSIINGVIDSGTQQQWLSRNNKYSGWMGENWNLVMMGDDRAGLPKGEWPEHSYTKVEETERICEKPFLMFDESQGYGVFVPAYREHSREVTWSEENTTGEFISIDEFYVAKPGNSAKAINQALSEGKHLLFTPGIYELTETIHVEKENTIVLGLGLATLHSDSGITLLETSNAQGIKISGILFDAGSMESDNLLVVGYDDEASANSAAKNVKNPITLSDIFFRVGGIPTEQPCKSKCCITINASNVIGDNFWVWRADHGDHVGWKENTADYGLVVNGDDVSIYALMVEHFQKYQTLWKGNRGKIVMYQSEVPYDIPSQKEWITEEGKKGFASIHVDNQVTDFQGIGIGIYLYNRDQMVVMGSAMEVPDAPEVSVTNIIDVVLNGNPGIVYVINEAGHSVVHIGDKQMVTHYCNGEWSNK